MFSTKKKKKTRCKEEFMVFTDIRGEYGWPNVYSYKVKPLNDMILSSKM